MLEARVCHVMLCHAAGMSGQSVEAVVVSGRAAGADHGIGNGSATGEGLAGSSSVCIHMCRTA